MSTLTYAVFIKVNIAGGWINACDWKEKYNDALAIYSKIKLDGSIIARKIVIKTEELDDYLVEESRGNENGN